MVNNMKILVTGVCGQLGHDVMNELYKCGFEGIGTDIAESYSGVADGTPVTKMPYVSLDITDKEKVSKVITKLALLLSSNCSNFGRRYEILLNSSMNSRLI